MVRDEYRFSELTEKVPSLERPARLQGPMCLSAHPHNTQLSDDEIIERARRSAGLEGVVAARRQTAPRGSI